MAEDRLKQVKGKKGPQAAASMTKGAKGTGSKSAGKAIPKGGISNSGSGCPIH